MWRASEDTDISLVSDLDTVAMGSTVIQNFRHSEAIYNDASPSQKNLGRKTDSLQMSFEEMRTPTPKKRPLTGRKSVRYRGRSESATDFEAQPSPKTPKLCHKQSSNANHIRGSAVKAQMLFKDLPVGLDPMYGGMLTPDVDWKKFEHSKQRPRSWSSEFQWSIGATSPFAKVAEACDIFCQSADKSTTPRASDPLPPNRQLTADLHEKKIYTPKGGEITIVRMSAETLKMNRQHIALPPERTNNNESSEWSSDDESD